MVLRDFWVHKPLQDTRCRTTNTSENALQTAAHMFVKFDKMSSSRGDPECDAFFGCESVFCRRGTPQMYVILVMHPSGSHASRRLGGLGSTNAHTHALECNLAKKHAIGKCMLQAWPPSFTRAFQDVFLFRTLATFHEAPKNAPKYQKELPTSQN